MTCDQILDRLDRYAARTLAPAERLVVERHLEGCDACRAESVRLLPLLAGAAGLPRAIDPPRDLWPDIATRINRRKVVAARFGGRLAATPWLRPPVLAAAALALVVVSSAVTAIVLRRQPAEPPAGVPEVVWSAGDFAAVEAEYQGAAEEILRAVRNGRVALAPATVAILQRNLQVIDDAIRESREALVRDPGNPALRDLVLGAYRQRLDLLRRAAATTAL